MKLVVGSIAAAAFTLASTVGAVQAADLKLVTGPQGGSWYPLGGALKAMVEKAVPGTNVSVAPGGGVGNVKLVQVKKADIGFGNSATTVDALAGKGVFAGTKHTNVCNIGVLYPQYFQIVALANSGITDGGSMAGKAVTTQKRGTTGEQVTREYLSTYGLDFSKLSKVNQGSYNDSVNQMKDGNAQVFTLTTQVPAGAIMDIASARDIDVIGISDETIAKLQAINPGYKKIVIKAGSYPKQSKDVPTIGFYTHTIVRCDMDEKTAYGITKAMAEGMKDLGAIAKAILKNTLKDVAADIGVPMHPGATKYYKEKGVL